MEEQKKYLDSSIVPLIKAKVDEKQDKLVSGTNIKTINNESVLGKGNIELPAAQLYATTGQNVDGAMTQKAVTDSLESMSDQFEEVDTSLSKTVQLNLEIKDDTTSTVTLTKTSGALNSDTTSTSDIALPVASATSAGVLNPATYQAIEDASNQLEVITKGSVVIEDLPADATQEQLTDAWKTETGLEELINGARIYDKSNGKQWTYYTNANEWEPADVTNPEVVEIEKFTNTQAGLIKGDADTAGKIFAEADGTGSVNGWDALTTDVTNNTGDIADLKTDKQDTLIGTGEGQNIKTINGESLLGNGNIDVITEEPNLQEYTLSANTKELLLYPVATENSVVIRGNVVQKSDGSGANIALSTLNAVNNTTAGVMTPAQYTKLNNLPDNAIATPSEAGTAGQVLKLEDNEGVLEAAWANDEGGVTSEELGSVQMALQKDIDDNAADIAALEADKQDKLIGSGEGQNLKTINGESLLGTGDVDLPAAQLYDSTGTNEDGAMTQKATTEALTTLETKVNKNTTDITTLNGYVDTNVQLNTTVASDTSSTVTLVKTTAKLDDATNTTDTELALPVASTTSAGVMNPSTYQTIQDNAEAIEAILERSVLITGIPAEPTQEQLTNVWKTETGETELINGARIYDKDNGKIWIYFKNVQEWEPSDIVNPEIEISVFTNSNAGTIKGSATGDGKVFAEADGTGSVLGWDALNTKVTNNTNAISSINTEISGLGDTYALKTDLDDAVADIATNTTAIATNKTATETNASAITALQTNKQDKLVTSGDGQNIKTVNNESLLGAGNIELDIPEPMTAEEFEAAWNNA